MSTPSSPTSARRQPFTQVPPSSECNDSGSWLDALGGVVGEWLQGWGILGALRRRAGQTGGARSTPATPPVYSNPSTPSHQEHIELRQLSLQNPCYLRVESSRHGEGHEFNPTTLDRPAWCDACAHLVFYHAITCHNCDYICHEQCQELVMLDCKTKLTPDSQSSQEEPFVESCNELPETCQINQQETQDDHTRQEDNDEEDDKFYEDASNDKSEYDNVVVEVVEAEDEKHEEEQQEKDLPPLDREEAQQKELLAVDSNKMTEYMSTLRKKVNSLQSQLVTNDTLEAWVQHYNATAQGLQIAKENDGSYRGCIRVHLNLSRPINIVAGTRPPSIYDILQEDRTMEKTLTSFYMPRDCVKAIHITSKTTTREVIVALLRKFKVVDNPQKFALYERTYETQQSQKARLRRLVDNECPLVLALHWSSEGLSNKRLVLQENDGGDIQWEAFSLPELGNFLRILDREEEEYRNQIRDKYSLLRRRLQDQLNRCSQNS